MKTTELSRQEFMTVLGFVATHADYGDKSENVGYLVQDRYLYSKSIVELSLNFRASASSYWPFKKADLLRVMAFVNRCTSGGKPIKMKTRETRYTTQTALTLILPMAKSVVVPTEFLSLPLLFCLKSAMRSDPSSAAAGRIWFDRLAMPSELKGVLTLALDQFARDEDPTLTFLVAADKAGDLGEYETESVLRAFERQDGEYELSDLQKLIQYRQSWRATHTPVDGETARERAGEHQG